MSMHKLPPRPKIMWALVLILVFAALAGFYTSARFGGWAMEGDAFFQAANAESILNTQVIESKVRYNNGFAYAALLAFASEVSGIAPHMLVNWGNVWIVVFILAAFITYRELLGDAWLALFSTLLLFFIPDLMFYVLRGGHERVTWMLALLMLFLLARSLRHANKPGLLLIHIIGFYLIFWSMASGNVFFASTFASAIILSIIGAWLLGFFRRARIKDGVRREHFLRRLLLVSLACLVLVYVFINYTYWPALSFYYITRDFVNRGGLLVLGIQELETSASYTYLSKAWINNGVYLALVGPQFLIAALSFSGWAVGLRKQFSFDDRRWFVWWLYAAFGVLLLVGILADSVGFLQENMQLRMFTPFALFVAPMAALVLRPLFRTLSWRMPRFAVLLGGLCLVYGLVATMAKVTNEPLVANSWLFYAPGEQRAGEWMNGHIQNQIVWVDTWQHLPTAFKYASGNTTPGSILYIAVGQPAAAPYILITESTQLRANRAGIVVPAVYEYNQIYDNGFGQLYFRRPLTPYQK